MTCHKCLMITRVTHFIGALFFSAIFLNPFNIAGQTLFSDNFQTDSSANWTIFPVSGSGSTTDFTAQFAFDYSTQAYRYNGVTNHVPSSPNSGGTTKGLK